jgi:signal transduction histidine kinase
MDDRLAALHGHLAIASVVGRGTLITGAVPLTDGHLAEG